MTLDDVQFVLQLHARPHVDAQLIAPDAKQVLSGIEDPQRLSLIIEDDGRPVGMMLIGLLEPWLIELQRLAIAEPRRGYGRAALQWALEDAFGRRGVHRVWLEVRADNAPARALYESLGFVLEGTWRDGFRDADGRYYDLCAYGLLAHEYAPTKT